MSHEDDTVKPQEHLEKHKDDKQTLGTWGSRNPKNVLQAWLSLHLSGIWTKYLDFHDSCHFSGGGGDGKFPFWPPASVPVETGIGKPDFNLLLTLFILLLLQLAFFCRVFSSWRTKKWPCDWTVSHMSASGNNNLVFSISWQDQQVRCYLEFWQWETRKNVFSLPYMTSVQHWRLCWKYVYMN